MCDIHVSGCQLAASPLLNAQTTFVHVRPEVMCRLPTIYSSSSKLMNPLRVMGQYNAAVTSASARQMSVNVLPPAGAAAVSDGDEFMLAAGEAAGFPMTDTPGEFDRLGEIHPDLRRCVGVGTERDGNIFAEGEVQQLG